MEEMKKKEYARENRVYQKDKDGFTNPLRYTVEGVDMFTFSADPKDNSLLTVTKNGVSKTVLVDDVCGQYVFRLMKSRIKARGGAKGLAAFMEKALDENFMACYAWKVLGHVMDHMKPVVAK